METNFDDGMTGAISTAAASVCGACDANLADFPRLAGEADDAPRFARA
jgi:hypothetical protein